MTTLKSGSTVSALLYQIPSIARVGRDVGTKSQSVAPGLSSCDRRREHEALFLFKADQVGDAVSRLEVPQVLAHVCDFPSLWGRIGHSPKEGKFHTLPCVLQSLVPLWPRRPRSWKKWCSSLTCQPALVGRARDEFLKGSGRGVRFVEEEPLTYCVSRACASQVHHLGWFSSQETFLATESAAGRHIWHAVTLVPWRSWSR